MLVRLDVPLLSSKGSDSFFCHVLRWPAMVSSLLHKLIGPTRMRCVWSRIAAPHLPVEPSSVMTVQQYAS